MGTVPAVIAGELNWLISCEHGGNEVPESYSALFSSRHAAAMLASHRGYDPGAWQASIQLATTLAGTPQAFRPGRKHNGVYSCGLNDTVHWVASRATRLLVDLNRSINHSQSLSQFTQTLTRAERDRLIEEWYEPYRGLVERQIADRIQSGHRSIHLSIHTFTPRISGQWRAIDVGLLFDPSRPLESRLCRQWRRKAMTAGRRLRILENEPYAGTDDGLTTYLRSRFDASAYLGIELEICNRFFKRGGEVQHRLVQRLADSLIETTAAVFDESFE